MKKISIALISLLCMQTFALAESSKRVEKLSEFNGINVGDNFEVVIKSGSSYAVTFIVDSRVYDYCDASLQGSILNIKLDKKSFPKILKEQFRRKGEGIKELKAEITIPASADINSINLEDDAVLDVNTPLSLDGRLAVNASGNSKVIGMNIENASEVNIQAEKKARVEGRVTAKAMNVRTSHSATVDLQFNGTKLEIESEGSSIVDCNEKADETVIKTSNSSKVNLKGNSEKLTVVGKGFSNVDASSVNAEDVVVNLSGCTCNVTPSKTLNITLQSGAELIFGGKPVVEIVKIAKSSVTLASDVKDSKK